MSLPPKKRAVPAPKGYKTERQIAQMQAEATLRLAKAVEKLAALQPTIPSKQEFLDFMNRGEDDQA